jgi:hypothetical protein
MKLFMVLSIIADGFNVQRINRKAEWNNGKH